MTAYTQISDFGVSIAFSWVRNPSNEVSLKSIKIISLSRIDFSPKN